MKLSIYTFVRNGLYFDFHVVDMLRHHAPLVDEIVVNEGYSTDGTYEAISSIDPKIAIHRTRWDDSAPDAWHRRFKNEARKLCTGDWCILLDCDEFVPEWEFQRLREHLARTEEVLVPVRFRHFYGNYKVFLERPHQIIPERGWRIHRNRPDVEVWGDGANVRVVGSEYVDAPPDVESFEVHHFGNVRRPARLRQKWRTQARQSDPKNPRWDFLPSVVFDLLPHRWDDADFIDDLGIYEGPFLEVVRNNPSEFVRDDFWLLNHLRDRAVRPDAGVKR